MNITQDNLMYVCFLCQSSLRSDIVLASPSSVATSGKSTAPFYSFTAANPRKRSVQNPPAIGQFHLSGRVDPHFFYLVLNFFFSFCTGISVNS